MSEMFIYNINDKFQEYKRPRVAEGHPYVNICGGFVKWHTDVRSGDDISTYAIGNYFKTENEARRALDKLRAYQKIKDDAKGYRWTVGNRNCDDKNYYIRYDTDGWLSVNNSPWSKDLGQVYFASEEDAKYSLRIHRKEWELLYDLDEEENE